MLNRPSSMLLGKLSLLYLSQEYRTAPRVLLRRCLALLTVCTILVFFGCLVPARRTSILLPYLEARYDVAADLADTNPGLRTTIRQTAAGKAASYSLTLQPRFVSLGGLETPVTLYLIDSPNPADTWFGPERLLQGVSVLSTATSGLEVGLDWNAAYQLGAQPGDTITIGFLPRGGTDQQGQGTAFTLQATVRGVYSPTALGHPATIVAPLSGQWAQFVDDSYTSGRWNEMLPTAALLLHGNTWEGMPTATIAASLGVEPSLLRLTTTRRAQVELLDGWFENQGIEGTRVMATLLVLAALAYVGVLFHEMFTTLRQRSRNIAILTALGAPRMLSIFLTGGEFFGIVTLACCLAIALNKYGLYERLIGSYFPPMLILPMFGLGILFNIVTLVLASLILYSRAPQVSVRQLLAE